MRCKLSNVLLNTLASTIWIFKYSRVETGAKVDRTRTKCLHESNRQVGVGACRKIVPGYQQEVTKQWDASECLPYSTANVVFRKHLSAIFFFFFDIETFYS